MDGFWKSCEMPTGSSRLAWGEHCQAQSSVTQPCQGTALGNHSSSSAGSGHYPEHPSRVPTLFTPYGRVERDMFVYRPLWDVPACCPSRAQGKCAGRQLQEPTCGHSATSPQATLHNSTLPIALKGLLEQAPTLSAFSDPSSVSRRNIQVEQAI